MPAEALLLGGLHKQEVETVPRLQYAKPLTIDFGRDPREPFSTPVEGQEAEITPLFSTADELAARAPATCTCSSEFLLYADTAVRIPGLSKASFLVPAPLALREHKDCAMFVDRLPHRDGLDDTPLVLPHVERTTEDFKIRVTVANLSEKSITLPHMQALASLHVRFKIHDGYDAADEDPRKPSEKLTARSPSPLPSSR
eukprot:scaffold1044_cov120-Isochrysis_galbana.AAC.13